MYQMYETIPQAGIWNSNTYTYICIRQTQNMGRRIRISSSDKIFKVTLPSSCTNTIRSSPKGRPKVQCKKYLYIK